MTEVADSVEAPAFRSICQLSGEQAQPSRVFAALADADAHLADDERVRAELAAATTQIGTLIDEKSALAELNVQSGRLVGDQAAEIARLVAELEETRERLADQINENTDLTLSRDELGAEVLELRAEVARRLPVTVLAEHPVYQRIQDCHAQALRGD